MCPLMWWCPMEWRKLVVRTHGVCDSASVPSAAGGQESYPKIQRLANFFIYDVFSNSVSLRLSHVMSCFKQLWRIPKDVLLTHPPRQFVPPRATASTTGGRAGITCIALVAAVRRRARQRRNQRSNIGATRDVNIDTQKLSILMSLLRMSRISQKPAVSILTPKGVNIDISCGASADTSVRLVAAQNP